MLIFRYLGAARLVCNHPRRMPRERAKIRIELKANARLHLVSCEGQSSAFMERLIPPWKPDSFRLPQPDEEMKSYCATCDADQRSPDEVGIC